MVKDMTAAKKLPYVDNGARTACFAATNSMISKFFKEHKKAPNRLLFEADFEKHSVSKWHVPEEMRLWWVRECQKAGLMPEYIGKHYAETGNYLLRILNLDINQLYVHLVAARIPQENPGMVHCMYHMIRDLDMDFFSAFAVAHRRDNVGSGHCLVPIRRAYDPKQNLIKKMTGLDVTAVLGLVDFIRNHEPTRAVKDLKAGSTELGSFSMHATCFTLAKEVKGKKTGVSAEELIELRLGKIKVRQKPHALRIQ